MLSWDTVAIITSIILSVLGALLSINGRFTRLEVKVDLMFTEFSRKIGVSENGN